jgi:hypothetical protein
MLELYNSSISSFNTSQKYPQLDGGEIDNEKMSLCWHVETSSAE